MVFNVYLYYIAKVTGLRHSLSETQAALKKAGCKQFDSFAATPTQAEVNSLQVIIMVVSTLCVIQVASNINSNTNEMPKYVLKCT